jgi:hypothetical protein
MYPHFPISRFLSFLRFFASFLFLVLYFSGREELRPLHHGVWRVSEPDQAGFCLGIILAFLLVFLSRRKL